MSVLRIKQLRRERGMTQTELAAVIGVKRSCIANWEGGIRIPPSDKVAKICDYFDVSVDYLCGKTNKRNEVIAPPSFRMDITMLNAYGQEQLITYYNFLMSQEKFIRKN